MVGNVQGRLAPMPHSVPVTGVDRGKPLMPVSSGVAACFAMWPAVYLKNRPIASRRIRPAANWAILRERNSFGSTYSISAGKPGILRVVVAVPLQVWFRPGPVLLGEVLATQNPGTS